LKEVALENSLSEPTTSGAQGRGLITTGPLFSFANGLFSLIGGSLDMKNATFFKNLLQTETNNLRGKCDMWEQRLASVSHSELAQEEIRSAIGMTEILMNKKGRFEQFSDLIHKFEFNLGDQKVESEDLQVGRNALLFSLHPQ
jgi:hypothetical protein